MTAPSYTEDLSDLTMAEDNTNWYEATGWAQGGAPQGADPDWPYIQGSYAVTQTNTKSGVSSMVYDNLSGTGGHGTDGAYFVWQNFSIPTLVDTYTNGGFRIIVGSGLGDFKGWDVGGGDKGRYPYGGWQNSVVNTTVTADDTVGSPTSTEQYIGAAVNLSAGAGKGEPHCIDAIRYGRGTAIFEYGETANYATIDGFATQNDNVSNRWGLIQKISGGYLWKGRMSLGTASNAVDFRDSAIIIFIDWTPKVTANFNTIEIVNASSNVEMTGFQFICLDPSGTASKGRWITTNDATVALDSCLFQDMATFTFDSNTTVDECTFKRCGQVDAGGGDLSFSSILESSVTGGGSAGAGALLWNDSGDPNTKTNDMTFTKGAGSHHAIEFGTSAPTTINLTNITVSGFSASNQQTTSALYFPDTGSDVTWNVAHTGTSGTLSYYKARAGDTVNVTSSVSVTITVKDVDGNLLSDVQTAVYKISDRTEIMNEDTVDGVASENYTGSTPVDVEVRCRKASGGTNYKNFSSNQQITASGLTMAVCLDEDPNNAT